MGRVGMVVCDDAFPRTGFYSGSKGSKAFSASYDLQQCTIPQQFINYIICHGDTLWNE